mgnify:FL=1
MLLNEFRAKIRQKNANLTQLSVVFSTFLCYILCKEDVKYSFIKGELS